MQHNSIVIFRAARKFFNVLRASINTIDGSKNLSRPSDPQRSRSRFPRRPRGGARTRGTDSADRKETGTPCAVASCSSFRLSSGEFEKKAIFRLSRELPPSRTVGILVVFIPISAVLSISDQDVIFRNFASPQHEGYCRANHVFSTIFGCSFSINDRDEPFASVTEPSDGVRTGERMI